MKLLLIQSTWNSSDASFQLPIMNPMWAFKKVSWEVGRQFSKDSLDMNIPGYEWRIALWPLLNWFWGKAVTTYLVTTGWLSLYDLKAWLVWKAILKHPSTSRQGYCVIYNCYDGVRAWWGASSQRNSIISLFHPACGALPLEAVVGCLQTIFAALVSAAIAMK